MVASSVTPFDTLKKLSPLKKLLILCAIIASVGYTTVIIFSEEEDDDTLHEPGSMRSRTCSSSLDSGEILSWEPERLEKWIVLVIDAASSQTKILPPPPGWKLLIVADDQDIEDYSSYSPSESKSITFLNSSTQNNLGYKILKHLSWSSSHTRKVIGYLYAIQHGAQIIFDTDIETYSQLITTTDGSNNFEGNFALDTPTTRGLLLSTHQENNIANPYSHFGQGSIYPRGYPMHQLIDQEFNNTYTVCPNHPTPLIQQGVLGGHVTDVDAYYRLIKETSTSSGTETRLNVQFDPFAPPVIYPRNVFAPSNSKSTIYHYESFWGLVLPTSLPSRVSDIWRGYWAQKLLWLINGNLGFYLMQPKNEKSNASSNSHSNLNNVREEAVIHTQALDLIQFLSKWECPLANFYKCMNLLSDRLAKKGFWSWDDVKLIAAWIEDLNLAGYQEPKINLQTPSSSSPCCDDKGQSTAVFYPVRVETIQEKKQMYKKALREFCNFTNESAESNKTTTFPSTLLVVTFNEVSQCKHIWLLDIIYRPAYQNIVYCVYFEDSEIFQNFSSSAEFQRLGLSRYSVVSANTTTSGNFAYECTLRAIEMNYGGVTDYFVLQDDVLLNYWNNVNFNTDEMWIYRSGLSVLDTQIPYDSPTWSKWGWWRTEFGLNNTKEALGFIYSSRNQVVKQYTENRAKFGYNETVTMYGETDSYHLPGSKKEIFYEIGHILRRFNVYMEIGVHIILSGLSSPENVVIFPGISLWGGERAEPFKKFNISNSVIHPVKLSQVIMDVPFRMEYCDKYVSNILDNV